MKQELFIGSEVVGYSLLTKNIISVMGRPYIYGMPTKDDVLRIVYRGLTRTCGLTEMDFLGGFDTGEVRMRKRQGQYTLWMIYGLLRGRISEVNKEMKIY